MSQGAPADVTGAHRGGSVDDLPTIVVIGARSRAGRALCRLLPSDRVVAVHRGGAPGLAVETYEAAPSDGVIPAGSVVVNCVGTPRGSAEELERINLEVALAWARAATRAGAAAFVQLSSFSVYGPAPFIGNGTPEAPGNAYGRIKLKTDRALMQGFAKDMPIAALRIPMLFGSGPDKLSAMVAATSRLNLVPRMPSDVRRSMLSYDGLAHAVVKLASTRRDGVVHFADPQPFDFDRLARTIADVSGKSPRRLPIGQPVSNAIKLALPALHARLFESSLLDPAASFDCDIPAGATLPDAMRQLVAAGTYAE